MTDVQNMPMPDVPCGPLEYREALSDKDWIWNGTEWDRPWNGIPSLIKYICAQENEEILV